MKRTGSKQSAESLAVHVVRRDGKVYLLRKKKTTKYPDTIPRLAIKAMQVHGVTGHEVHVGTINREIRRQFGTLVPTVSLRNALSRLRDEGLVDREFVKWGADERNHRCRVYRYWLTLDGVKCICPIRRDKS